MPVVLATRIGDCAAIAEEAPIHHPPMPLSHLELLCETPTDVVALDYNRRIHRYPAASNCFLSACISATQGNIKESLEIAKKLHHHFHEALALFLVRRGFVRESLELEGLSSWWKLKFCVSNLLLSDSIPLLKKTVEEYKARVSRNKLSKKGQHESGIKPFINLYDLTSPDQCSTIDFCQEHPTRDEIMTVAGELAALCRSYTQPAEADAVSSLTETGETDAIRPLANEVLESVSTVDPPRYFMLEALQLVLTKSPVAQLSALSGKIQTALSSAEATEDVERLKSALLFTSTCIDDPKLVSTAWSKIVPQPQK